MEEAGVREITIAPGSARSPLNIGELFRYRELLYLFVWRDVKVRYKQSVLGVAWVALKPLSSMAIFTIIFGKLAKLPSEGVPYAVFVILGLVPWMYFSSTLSSSTTSVVAGSNLISKVYFPRILIPIGTSLSLMVDLLVSLVVMVGVMLIYGMLPAATALLSPMLIVLTAVAALGPGLLFAALNVKYRDVGNIAPFLLQLWTYATPVVYSVDLVPEKYRWILYLNPMTGVVDSFRACFIPGKPMGWELLAISAVISMAMFTVGMYYFANVERTFADNI